MRTERKAMGYNIIVGQSGGPTAVINATLAGVFQNAQRRAVQNVYGMRHGIRGFLEGELVNLGNYIKGSLEFEILKRTPSSFLGSCRYRLPDPAQDDAVYRTVFKTLRDRDIQAFLYIGGNDSMDTIMKLSRYGKATGSDIRFIGIPKTIDNDLLETDHTPGYGSAAKYIAITMKEIIRDATVYGTPNVTIVEIMGRNSGWLTMAASLAVGDDCEGVDMICPPEVPFDVECFTQRVDRALREKKDAVIVAVSEGLKLADGRYVCELSDDARYLDAFGHQSLTGTARYLSNLVARQLKVKTRCIEFSTLQRCAGHITSRTDITEAYQVGGAGVKAALEGITGHMITLHRVSDDPYQAIAGMHPVDYIANLEKKVPAAWIDRENLSVTEDAVRYVRPLVQAELPSFFIDGLVRHLSLRFC